MTGIASGGDQWIRRFHPAAEGAPRLVCLPHAGGSASFYFPVSKALSPGIEVLAVQYPGRQDRRFEACVRDIGVLADRICEALGPWTAGRAPAVLGHSMGATLGFEVAWRLQQRANLTVRHLFASGRRAPSTRRDENVHKRDDAGVIEELRLLNGTGLGLLENQETRDLMLPAIRGDYTAIETYVPSSGAVLSCPVTVLTGEQDPKTTLDEARAWSIHTTGDFDLKIYPGGHFFLLQHVPEVLGLISKTLAPISG
ncbi:thioesterase II family protein [Frankia sp. R82]|uniref:thioesterase II family protein n=1 Tax=Frankia sp. R82 TaxID=2950553 RepID=UPI002044C7C0|nr:alpha/beta fold hydrolase [Frankia sp. R82]MCM3884968.1 alpha/beta fold hydrolase [Frankia sp. R82]